MAELLNCHHRMRLTVTIPDRTHGWLVLWRQSCYPFYYPYGGNSSLLLTHLGADERTRSSVQPSARRASGGFRCLAQEHLICG